uniref:Transposable element Tc3 transposase n=1 Tax=Cacopsylla melanoneura TaxID=428564 RepID=A0A8D9FCZ9_9HEMI
MGNHIIGPLFYRENLTGELYLSMLEDTINPLITDLVENCIDENGNPEFNADRIVFQHDGCPAHFDCRVRAYLDDNFPNRWIGRRGPQEWSPRSPDFAPNDFFLWGYLKSVVYRTPPSTIEDLKIRIQTACNNITPETFKNVRAEFHNRMFYCLEVNGQHFEHLLN